jgi:hypothetical protein
VLQVTAKLGNCHNIAAGKATSESRLARSPRRRRKTPLAEFHREETKNAKIIATSRILRVFAMRNKAGGRHDRFRK